jgi:DNA-binding transcriptional LysR family regulator
MEPTIFGEAVMRYARVVFEDLDELREELAAIEAGDIGKVRVGAVMAPAPELLTQAIVSLKAAHPRLQISVQIDTSDVLVQALQQDQLDIVIGRIPDGFPALDLSIDCRSAGSSRREDHRAAQACGTGAISVDRAAASEPDAPDYRPDLSRVTRSTAY